MCGDTKKIPVCRLMDKCPYTILEDMPAPRFYSMFALGSISHAAVVSNHGEFRGVIGRRNLISASGRKHAPHTKTSSLSGSGSPKTNQGPILLGNVKATGDAKVPEDAPPADAEAEGPVSAV